MPEKRLIPDDHYNQRKLIFVSHATPEDNEFARWFAVKLAAAGYMVWADVEKLIGGEKFWQDIEEAIRNHAAKVLWCGSRTSVNKSGVLRELEIARETEKTTGRNIIVPLRLDDVPFSDFPLGIASEINIVSFMDGWASGLNAVLRTLERAKVETVPNAHQRLVEWWTHRYRSDEGVKEGSESHSTNIFPLVGAPEHLNFFRLRRQPPKTFDYGRKKFPARPYADGLITHASADEIKAEFREYGVASSDCIPWVEFIKDGWPELGISDKEAWKRTYWMIRFGFRKLALSQKFQSYELAQQNECFWLLRGNAHQDEYAFVAAGGRVARRALVGYNSYGITTEGVKQRRYWHFAIQPRPIFKPFVALVLKTHVVFTTDGRDLIDSDAKQHSARRSACKSWWNDEWRDRLLAATAYLAGGSGVLSVPLAANVNLEFSAMPLNVESSRQYSVLEKQPFEKMPYEISDSEDYTDYTGEADE